MHRSRALACVLPVVLAALAGCLGDPPESTGGSPPDLPPLDAAFPACDVDDGAAPSGNAPMRSAFLGPREEVAARLAEAVDDPLVGDARRPNDWTRAWDTASGGSVHHSVQDGGNVHLLWRTPDAERADATEAQLNATLDAVLAAFGIAEDDALRSPRHGTGFDVAFRQLYHPLPRTVSGTGGHVSAFESVSLSFGAFHDLTDARVAVNVTEASATAAAHVRCLLDEAERTEADGYACAARDARFGPMLRVANASLAYSLHVACETPRDPGHCDLTYAVAVDVESGALLDSFRPACD